MSVFTTYSPKKHQQTMASILSANDGLPVGANLSQEQIACLALPKHRNRIFTPLVTLRAFLTQVMSPDKSQQAAVARVRAEAISRGDKVTPSANTSAYSQARSALPVKSLANLARSVAINVTDSVPPEWLWRGKKILIVDGTTISMPDTSSNQLVYPQSKTQKEGIGFPIALCVAFIDYFSGALCELAMGPFVGKGTGEHSLFRQLMAAIKPDQILLGDCYYPSYFVVAELTKLGIDFVFPIHNFRKYDFNKGKQLGDKDHITEWKKPKKPAWMSQSEYNDVAPAVVIREVQIENHRPGFRTKNRVLVTSFLEAAKVSKADLANLYDYRWFVELSLRSIKDTMGMDILRGKTSEMVGKEIWAHVIAYNLIRKVMVEAAKAHGKTAAQISFKLALQTINAFEAAGLLSKKDSAIYQKLLEAIVCKTVGNRPGRKEPRLTKRRPKPFSMLQKARGLYNKIA